VLHFLGGDAIPRLAKQEHKAAEADVRAFVAGFPEGTG
jgi:hypothetical protein